MGYPFIVILYRVLREIAESAEHSRLRDVPKISRKHFSENSSVRTTSDAQTSWAHEGRVVFCSIFSGIFFVQARVSTCAHLNEGHDKMPRRPDGKSCRRVAVLAYPNVAHGAGH